MVAFGRINSRVVKALAQAPEVQEQAQVVADRIRDEARKLAPVATGNLRDGITSEQVPGDEAEVRVGWTRDAWYGRLVELGTVNVRAQPHLRPAAIKVGGRNTRAVSD